MTDEQISIMAAALVEERARTSGREGPYGIYLYERHHIRDFRNPRLKEYGQSVEIYDDYETAKRRHALLTEEHYLKIALKAVQ